MVYTSHDYFVKHQNVSYSQLLQCLYYLRVWILHVHFTILNLRITSYIFPYSPLHLDIIVSNTKFKIVLRNNLYQERQDVFNVASYMITTLGTYAKFSKIFETASNQIENKAKINITGKHVFRYSSIRIFYLISFNTWSLQKFKYQKWITDLLFIGTKLYVSYNFILTSTYL